MPCSDRLVRVAGPMFHLPDTSPSVHIEAIHRQGGDLFSDNVTLL